MMTQDFSMSRPLREADALRANLRQALRLPLLLLPRLRVEDGRPDAD